MLPAFKFEYATEIFRNITEPSLDKKHEDRRILLF